MEMGRSIASAPMTMLCFGGMMKVGNMCFGSDSWRFAKMRSLCISFWRENDF